MNKTWIKILLLAIIGEALIFATPHFVYAAPVSLDPDYSPSLLTSGLASPANGLIFRSTTNDLLVSEYKANKVSRIDATTGAVNPFASVASPDEMAINSKGEVFVKTHMTGGPINRFDSNGNFLGSFSPFSGFPTGIAFDKDDNLYVADNTTGTIWKFAKGVFASPTVFASGFSSLEGIAFSPSGQLFAADHLNGKVYQVTDGGTTLDSHTLWASGLSTPLNFAFDLTSGDIFVSNFSGIVRLSAPGVITTFASGFIRGFGVAVFDLDFDTTGNLYVDDFTQGEVWKFTRKDASEPTPTPIPGPAPFLDLPWDYEGKGLSFNEAALSINSYFDHEYPLLSSGVGEPNLALGSLTNYEGRLRSNLQYSSHDGYDYGNPAQVHNGDPVLAAADGCASYNYSSAGGHTIKIDHRNYYQTRYLHLQDTGLVTKETASCVNVAKGQQIGLVGSTGNSNGAHIHFGVVEDKNQDGNFEDNTPDGATDPFGWQSTTPDPWETYPFFYNGMDRTGNRSYYLWNKKLDSLESTLTANGGAFDAGRYTVDFPQDATDQSLNLNIQSAPIAEALGNLVSIGTTLDISAFDVLGNLVTSFQKLFDITIDFSSFDLTRYNTDTLSFYSSSDGVTWTKEPTIIDLLNQTATTQVDHLSQFALMAERIDTIPPTTTATVSGQQGQPNWFRGDVTLTLNAEDNENGLGVDYTLFKIEGRDWETYTSPLVFTEEGHHRIEFYSVDNDENIEEIKSIEFDIDKTIPEAKIFIDQDKQDLVIEGIDQNQTAVEKQDNTETNKKHDAWYIITDQAGNTIKLYVKDKDKEKEDKFKIYSIQYNQDAPIDQRYNHYYVKYKEKKDQLNVREQKFEIKKEVKIRIKYDSKKNQSSITTKLHDQEKTKETRDGLILLQLTTEKGTLKYSY